jgi:hypothetical protein
LKVAVEGGVVKYYRNATLLYTSTVVPTYPLQVDTSLNTVNAAVYSVVIAGARLTASPINYVLQDVQGSTRAVMSGTSVIARHAFQPFGEEIAGVGMCTSGQGFAVEDEIRYSKVPAPRCRRALIQFFSGLPGSHCQSSKNRHENLRSAMGGVNMLAITGFFHKPS